MSRILEWIEERHEGAEPRVLIEDVQDVLREIVKPDSPDSGQSVALIATRARVSTRTVYRCLNPGPGVTTIGLDLADRLCLAADSHLAHCRLQMPNGDVVPYAE